MFSANLKHNLKKMKHLLKIKAAIHGACTIKRITAPRNKLLNLQLPR